MPKPAIIRFDPKAKMEVIPGPYAEHVHSWLDGKAHGLSAGIWDAAANDSGWIEYPVDEFMIVLEGEIVVVEESGPVSIKAGESFIMPKGIRCKWTVPNYAKKFFVIYENNDGPANKGPLKVIKLDTGIKLDPSEPPPPSLLHSSVPSQHTHEYFKDATGQLTVGVWDTTGYHRKLIDFPRHELMHLLEGSVTFTDDKGGTQTFRAGDTFFVPLGTPNSWKSEGYLRKIYCIFQPKTGT